MKDKTFDGQTAGFLAMVMNAISRCIPKERIEELMLPSNNPKLRALLLPLLHDRLPSVCAGLLEFQNRVDQIITFVPDRSTKTTRVIFDEAYERKYAFLYEVHAIELARQLELISSSIRLTECCIPFMRNDVAYMFWLPMGETKAHEVKINLNEIDFSLRCYHPRFFFRAGFNDRSDCFKP